MQWNCSEFFANLVFSLAMLGVATVSCGTRAYADTPAISTTLLANKSTSAATARMPISANQPIVFDLPQIATELQSTEGVDGLRRKVLMDDFQTQILLLSFEEGGELPAHIAQGLATVTVISGAVDFYVLGKPHHLTAGKAIVILPGSSHSLKAVEKSVVLVTINKASSPALLKP